VAQVSGMQSASAVLHWLMWPVWMYHIIAYYFKWIEYRGNVIYNGMFFVFYFVKKNTFLIIPKIHRDIFFNFHCYTVHVVELLN